MSWTDRARLGVRGLVAGAALLGAGLGGCASAPHAARTADAGPPGFDKTAPTPLDQYRIAVERTPEQLALSVHHPVVLSPGQEAALERFAGRWRDGGGEEAVRVEAPVGGGPDAHATARAVASALSRLGVPPARLRLAEYDAGGDPQAPVMARYERYEALGPDCRQGWDNLVATKSNAPSTHFGCATTANLAAMIADPHDILHPRPMTPADSIRRAVVLDKYRQGAITSSPKDPQAQGVVSSVVN